MEGLCLPGTSAEGKKEEGSTGPGVWDEKRLHPQNLGRDLTGCGPMDFIPILLLTPLYPLWTLAFHGMIFHLSLRENKGKNTPGHVAKH